MKNSYNVIGMMSGTSLDGLDMAYCRFNKVGDQWRYDLLASESISYSRQWQQTLQNAIHQQKGEIAVLDQEYGKWLGARAKEFIEKNDLKVDFIASHGHTIFHQPEAGITVQIGAGQQLANVTGKTVICDFRKLDVQRGGQGAPLVPIGDELLLSQYIACINMGGIANVSFRKEGKRVAFDIGMANMLLNYLSRQLDKDYDESGQLARSGAVDKSLFNALNNLEYHKLPFPKSTGYEWFLADIQPIIDASKISIIDKLASAVEHEAFQVGAVLKQYLSNSGEVLITGGGALNAYFIERLTQYTPDNLKLVVPKKKLIEFKEAIVFGLMGVLRKRNEINCLKSVTGAATDSCSGDIFDPQ